jgi:hypothetical protein
MGVFSAWRLANSTPRIDGISTPYTQSQLSGIVLGDIFEGVEFPLTRAEAMRVPAVAKARNLLAPLVGAQPLVAMDKNGPLAKQPAFLSRLDQDVISPFHMWTSVVDDLIFYAASLLWVTRGTDGFPISLERVSPDRWTITDGVILVDEQPVQDRQVIYIPSATDALLDVGSRSIKGARDIENAWVGRARNPIPAMVLKQTDADAELDQAEVDRIITAYSQQRRSPDGSITFLPSGLSMEALGEASRADVFIEARNALRTDIGGFVGIPASVMDSSLATSTLTYSTAEGNRNAFYDQALPLYSKPIEHRLSLDDVVPRGQRVRFDFTQLFSQLPNPTDTPTED